MHLNTNQINLMSNNKHMKTNLTNKMQPTTNLNLYWINLMSNKTHVNETNLMTDN